MTISQAKAFFENASTVKTSEMLVIQRDSTIEELCSGELTVDWTNASTYFDTFKKQSVMEAPIINSPLSKNVPNWENVAFDTLKLANIKKDHRLLVILDSLGTMTYAIMKIEGSYSNHLAYNMLSNSYRGISPNFVGFITYVNEKDIVLARHLIRDGNVYAVTSTHGLQGSGNDVQDRDWIECFYTYFETPCGCEPQHALGQSGCTCAHGASWTVTETCHVYSFVSTNNNDSGGTSNYPGIGGGYGANTGSPYNGTGGNYGGNQDNAYGAGSNFLLLTNKFKTQFGLDLLDPELVEMAEECWVNGINYEIFSDCVILGTFKGLPYDQGDIDFVKQYPKKLNTILKLLKKQSFPPPPPAPGSPNPISVSNPICPEFFNWIVNSKVRKMNVGDFSINFLPESGNIPFNLELSNLYFEFYSGVENSPCLANSSLWASSALNTAILEVNYSK